MKTTIDRAGRIVVPRPIRDKAGLTPGTEIEITLDGFAVRIARAVEGPTIERKGKRLVVRPSVPATKRREVDIAGLIEKERDRWPL